MQVVFIISMMIFFAYRAYDYMYVKSEDQYYLIDYRYTYDIDCKDGFAYRVILDDQYMRQI